MASSRRATFCEAEVLPLRREPVRVGDTALSPTFSRTVPAGVDLPGIKST